jgi:protein-S-isoprenylcysteine O-methyltransferase Ste14
MVGHSKAARLWISIGAACANASLAFAAALAHPSTPISIIVGYAALSALVGGVEAGLAPSIDRASNVFSPAALAAQASGLLFMAVWLGSPLFAIASKGLWFPLFGCAAIVAGATLRASAIVNLGARFNSDNHIGDSAILETKGLYRHLAHPSELGLLLLAAGASVFWGAMTLPIIASLYLVTIARLCLEETALTRRHGARYALYRRSTLDPFPHLALQGARRS